MRYFTPKEIKSEPKLWKFVNFSVFVGLILILCIAMVFEKLVYEPLIPLYYGFSVLTALILFFPSKDNPKRRIYHSILLMLNRTQEEMFFRPEKNISRKRD